MEVFKEVDSVSHFSFANKAAINKLIIIKNKMEPVSHES
jgi:hypothetical protein